MSRLRGYRSFFAAALLGCCGCLAVSERDPLSAQEAVKRVPVAVVEAKSAELLSRVAGEYFSGRDQVVFSDFAAAVRSDPVSSAELARMVLQKAADTLAVAFPQPGISPTEYVRTRIRRRIECDLSIAIAEYDHLSHLISPTPEQSGRLDELRLEFAHYLGCEVRALPELLPDALVEMPSPLPELPEWWRKFGTDEVNAAILLAGNIQKLPGELKRNRAYHAARDERQMVCEALALAAHFRLRLDRFARTSLALREMDGETLFLLRKFQAYERCDRAELEEYGKLPVKKSLLYDMILLQDPR